MRLYKLMPHPFVCFKLCLPVTCCNRFIQICFVGGVLKCIYSLFLALISHGLFEDCLCVCACICLPVFGTCRCFCEKMCKTELQLVDIGIFSADAAVHGCVPSSITDLILQLVCLPVSQVFFFFVSVNYSAQNILICKLWPTNMIIVSAFDSGLMGITDETCCCLCRLFPACPVKQPCSYMLMLAVELAVKWTPYLPVHTLDFLCSASPPVGMVRGEDSSIGHPVWAP